MTAEKRIAQFLEDHPTGPLKVVVGYSSIWGLAWLHRHTQDRRVDLLIGNTEWDSFDFGTREDREDAKDFLKRKDVTVAGWNKETGDRSRTIMIGWLIDGEEPHLLAGSAHLSKNGLKLNRELMAEIKKDEITAAAEKMNKFFDEAKDCRKVLTSYVKQPAKKT